VNDPGVGSEVCELHGLRQWQHWRRRKRHRMGHCRNRADGAGIVGVLVRIMIGHGLLLLDGSTSRTRLRLRGDSMEMPERQRKLDRERKQRNPRALFDVRSEPSHADAHPNPEGRDISTASPLYYNIAGIAPRQPVSVGLSPQFAGLCDFRNASIRSVLN
jgi:hypothetical protein